MGTKTKNQAWKEDVEELVEKVTFEEAHLAVQELFDSAFSRLTPTEQSLLEAHWEGTPTQELAKELDLTLPQTQALINHLKKQLVSVLRSSIQTRQ